MPTSPSNAGATTWVASPSNSVASGEISETLSMGTSALQRLGFLDDLVNAAHHVERLLGKFVEFTGDDPLEARDGLLEVDELARDASELFGHGNGCDRKRCTRRA